MIKQIAMGQLRTGMFLDHIDGSWLDHPMWRRRFPIDDAATLDKVVRCGAASCWIDTDKGLDPDLPPLASALDPPPDAPSMSATDVAAAADKAPAPAQVSMDAELQRAAKVRDQLLDAVKTLYARAADGTPPDIAGLTPVIAQVEASVSRNAGALVSLTRLKTKDCYTYMHSVAVCVLMVTLGKQLGLSCDECALAGLGGLLHDVGKAFIPPEVINKPGRLSAEEFELMRTHARRGHEWLQSCEGIDAAVLEVCLHHHEKYDGTGYPSRLSGEAIPLLARMGAVCDVYDAVTSTRSYKPAWDPSAALTEMASWAGHFDRRILAAFIHVMGIYPPGSLVRMRSGNLGLVIEGNRQHIKAPRVRVFFSTRTGEPIPHHMVDLSDARANDKIIATEPRDRWNFPHLDRLQGLPQGEARARP